MHSTSALESSATLAGHVVVFTGKLWSLSRKDARALVERAGGLTEDEVTTRTTMLVLGSETFPQGPPDEGAVNDGGTHRLKLRRAHQLNRDAAGRVEVLGEDAFCIRMGLPSLAELREKHYGRRDVLGMYPALREDHLRYLQKWGFIRPSHRNKADTFLTFADLTLLRQVHQQLQQGLAFRAILRDLQSARTGQLTFDFRIDAQPARIIALAPRRVGPARPVEPSQFTHAEEAFLRGSVLDDGTPERQEEAAEAYRRALDEDPDLVAALINLANIRYAKDELAEAQALYERAILLDSSYFEAHFNLGNIHHDHGEYQEAERCYQEALALNPAYADAHFYLAVTLEKMSRSPEARQYWRQYQSLAPQGEWVELAREFSD